MHPLDTCPCRAGPPRRNAPFARVVQQVDLGPPPLTVEEHVRAEYWCGHCRKGYDAPMPRPIETGGLVGPGRTALIAYLKGVCHASFSTVRRFPRDVVRVTISRGQLAKVLAKVSTALDGPYQELLGRLPTEALLNVDETGHKDNGVRRWTWCFRAARCTRFTIDPRWSADVLIEVSGRALDGVLGCDCFSAYRRYRRECGVAVQFCLAHLIRGVEFRTPLPGPADRAYGERWREPLRALFGVIHRRERGPAGPFQQQLQAARDAVLRVGTTAVPPGRHARARANRLGQYGAACFTFATTPGVEPTNNLAEQAIRFVVIDRHITHGTRGAAGQRRSDRLWSVVATCGQQGRSVWEYLAAAVGSCCAGEAAPSLRGSGGAPRPDRAATGDQA